MRMLYFVVIAVSVSLLAGCGGGNPSEESSLPAAPETTVKATASQEKGLEKLPGAGITSGAYGRDDPFETAFYGGSGYTAETPKEGAFILEGIIWDEKNPLAFINGKIVRVGKKIGGYEVVEIKVGRVKLQKGDEILELKIP